MFRKGFENGSPARKRFTSLELIKRSGSSSESSSSSSSAIVDTDSTVVSRGRDIIYDINHVNPIPERGIVLLFTYKSDDLDLVVETTRNLEMFAEASLMLSKDCRCKNASSSVCGPVSCFKLKMLRFCTLNLSRNPETASQLGLDRQSSQFLFLFDGIPEVYKGPIKLEAFCDWVSNKLTNPILTINDESNATLLVTRKPMFFLGLFSTFGGVRYSEFATAANKVYSITLDGVVFVQTTSPAICHQLFPSSNTNLLFYGFRNRSLCIPFDGADVKAQKLLKFIFTALQGPSIPVAIGAAQLEGNVQPEPVPVAGNVVEGNVQPEPVAGPVPALGSVLEGNVQPEPVAGNVLEGNVQPEPVPALGGVLPGPAADENVCQRYLLTRTCEFGQDCPFLHPGGVPIGGYLGKFIKF